MAKFQIPPEGIRDARQLGMPRMLVLGLQHMFAMFGATILVPILVQGYGLPMSIQVTLFFAGIGTLLFHVLTKMKVPAFLGSSFAFLGGFESVANLEAYASATPDERLAYALGGVVVAGAIYIVFALVIKLVGVKRVMRFLPPIVTGPIIVSIGLILATSAVNNASSCWWLAALSLVVIIVANIWGRGMIKIIPILLGVVVPYVLVLILTLTGVVKEGSGAFVNLAAVAPNGAKDIIGVQPFSFPKFDLSAILVMAPIAIASMMEHVGDISAISATTEQNFIEDPGLHRTLLGDGLATSLAAVFGGPANTTYGENTGVLALTKVYDPWVVRIAAIFAIVLSFSPAFANVIGSIPSAIIGGVSFVLYGMISAIGVRNVVENKVDLTKSRNVIIAAVIFVSALGFNGIGGLTFNVGGTAITLTGLAIAAILGILLNAILPGKDYEFKTETGVNFTTPNK